MPKKRKPTEGPLPLEECRNPVVTGNLRALVGKESVNKWANRHELIQSSVNRIHNGGSDASAAFLDVIAAAVRDKDGIDVQGWQLMVQGFDPRNPPILLTGTDAEKSAVRNLVETFKQGRQRAVEHHDDSQSLGGDQWLGIGNHPKRRASDL